MSCADIKKYIGIPYEKTNCFGLIKKFYKDQFGVELKDYFDGVPPEGQDAQNLIVSSKGDFAQVQSPQFGDVVVIRLYGLESHVGVCLDDRQFLHSIKNTGSVIEPLKKYSRLIAGYYRLLGGE